MNDFRVSDGDARQQALSVLDSFIVHAPAGSGKTDLLVKRYLALLKTVKDPEEIIAITFTKKAAFEMKERILKSLGKSVLPARLRILTIDALCAKLARSMPMQSQFGEIPLISKDPALLYQKAARRLLTDEPWSDALWVMARHMQNHLGLLEELFAKMLACREQWLETLMSARAYQRTLGESASSQFREFLEKSMAAVCAEALQAFLDETDPGEFPEMEALMSFILTQQGQSWEGEWTVSGLQIFSDLCLTKTGTLRKAVDKRSGFPLEFPEMKARMKEFLARMEAQENWISLLQKAQNLPDPTYAEQEWAVVEALLEILPLLVSHLQVIFLEKGEVDFSEIALRALHALGDSESPTDLALMLDYQIRHILVDEFQDTSPTQFRLLEALVRGWEPMDGRTLFLVGDPMQSIYRFRQADVRLFGMALEQGVGGVPLTPIYLSSNFRSSPMIVDFCNHVFSRKALAIKDFDGEIHWYGRPEGEETPKVVQEIRRLRAANPAESIAVLGRSRSQVADILSTLLSQGIPAEALDMQNLADALVIRDLCSLLYAFSDGTDQLSWCSFLRSPWVGLSLEGVLQFSQAWHQEKDSSTCPEVLKQLKDQPAFQSSRVGVLLQIYESLCPKKNDLPVALWLFEAFQKLGGGAGFLEAKEAFATEQFFRLLEEFSPWEIPDQERLSYALSQRFIRAQPSENCVQVMTIHKSKGLEFDHVFVPKLHRMSARDDLSLLLFQERLTAHSGWQLLLAPIKSPKGESSSLYRYLYQEEQRLAAEENLRVLYVAATRAKKTLHFSFTTKASEKSDFKPMKGSFLDALWPFVKPDADETQDLSTDTSDLRSASLYRLSPAEDRPVQEEDLSVLSSELTEELNQPEWPELSTQKDRAVGTLVHRYFARWVNLKKIPEISVLDGSRAAISAVLKQLGVGDDELSLAVDRVIEVLSRALKSHHADFLFLAPHEDSHAEYRICKRHGHLVNFYIIDRTFVAEGVRYIIDYKVAYPFENESPAAFSARLKTDYEPQLTRYADLMREMGENRAMKLGLYLPVQDEWVWI